MLVVVSEDTLLAVRQLVRLAAEARRAAASAEDQGCGEVATFEDGKAYGLGLALEELCHTHGLNAEEMKARFT